MVLVKSPFDWYQAVTLILTFDLFQGQICCRAGDHNSRNLLVTLLLVYVFRKEMIYKSGHIVTVTGDISDTSKSCHDNLRLSSFNLLFSSENG